MRPIEPKLNLVACCLPPTRYGSLHPQKATSLRPAAYSTDSTAHSLLCQDRKKRVSPRLSRLSLSNRISKLVCSIDEPIADAWLSSAMASIRDHEELDVGRRQHLSVNLGSSRTFIDLPPYSPRASCLHQTSTKTLSNPKPSWQDRLHRTCLALLP